MHGRPRTIAPGTCIIALWFALAIVMTGIAIAQQTNMSVAKQQKTIALGHEEVKRLLLLMDTNKNGKISKQEFLSFMEAEFDRLDTDKSGELDPKEIRESEVRPSRPV